MFIEVFRYFLFGFHQADLDTGKWGGLRNIKEFKDISFQKNNIFISS